MSVLTSGTGIKKKRIEFILPFTALPWQVAPWQDQSDVLLLTGSAGGGKSKLAAEKVHAFCKRYPGAMGLMLRKTRESMTNSTVLLVERDVIGRDPQVRHFPSKNRFEYANGSILAYGGMKNEEQREQVRSIGQKGELDIVWMEEANRFTEDDFNEIMARMRGKAAPWDQIILSTNPDVPTHWIYKRLILGGEASVYYSGAKDNRHNPPEYLERLNRMTGILALRLRDGKWVQAEGAVYEGYDPDLHLKEPFEIPPSWRRFRVVDFGYTNPFVCQWWVMDGDGRMYRYREIYMTQRLVEDHAKVIKAMGDYTLLVKNNRPLSENDLIETTVCDHDAEDRATLERYGIPTTQAKKDVSPGIQAVTARLRKAGDGKPRLFLIRGALVEIDRRLDIENLPVCTEEEFPAYIWPKGSDGKPNKEAPVKENDHGMDALRYGVMHADSGLTGRLFY